MLKTSLLAPHRWPFFLFFFFLLPYLGIENLLKIFLLSNSVGKCHLVFWFMKQEIVFRLLPDVLDAWPAIRWFVLSFQTFTHSAQGASTAEQWKGKDVRLCICHNYPCQLKIVFVTRFVCLKIVTAVHFKSQEVGNIWGDCFRIGHLDGRLLTLSPVCHNTQLSLCVFCSLLTILSVLWGQLIPISCSGEYSNFYEHLYIGIFT